MPQITGSRSVATSSNIARTHEASIGCATMTIAPAVTTNTDSKRCALVHSAGGGFSTNTAAGANIADRPRDDSIVFCLKDTHISEDVSAPKLDAVRLTDIERRAERAAPLSRGSGGGWSGGPGRRERQQSGRTSIDAFRSTNCMTASMTALPTDTHCRVANFRLSNGCIVC